LPSIADAVGDNDRLLGRVSADLINQRRDEYLLADSRCEKGGAGQRKVYVGGGHERAVVGRPAGWPDRCDSWQGCFDQAGEGGLDDQRISELAGKHGLQRSSVPPYQVQFGGLPGGGEYRGDQQVPCGDAPLASIKAGCGDP